jgi:glycosyltransferase involved in cell wall biosynthesis
VQFHLLSFEGPDAYARAGGIASRIDGLARALDASEQETHLWFVGDPAAPGSERRGSHLELHRWCQWISAHHPAGVYDGETGKERDYARSLPPALLADHLRPALARGGRAVVLAEEWHTVHAVLHLDWLLRREGLRDRVALLWNANNTFGFEGIDWERLARAATITTVSRYMRQRMWSLGVDPIVIPNGLEPDVYAPAFAGHVKELQRILGGRTTLAKVARWDPDKRWLNAVEIVAAARTQGWRPLLIARGGAEAHGREVLARARDLGLHVAARPLARAGAMGLLEAVTGTQEIDVLLLESHLDKSARRLLFRGADAVLANSGHEPFGLVGLETMAAGGLACTGGTGEDYVVPGRNGLVLQTEDPGEFLQLFGAVRAETGADIEIRRAARRTSRDYAWSSIVERNLLPRVSALAGARPSVEPRVALPRRARRWSEVFGAPAPQPLSAGA